MRLTTIELLDRQWKMRNSEVVVNRTKIEGERSFLEQTICKLRSREKQKLNSNKRYQMNQTFDERQMDKAQEEKAGSHETVDNDIEFISVSLTSAGGHRSSLSIIVQLFFFWHYILIISI